MRVAPDSAALDLGVLFGGEVKPVGGMTSLEHFPDLRDGALPGFFLSLAERIEFLDGVGGDALRLQELLQRG